MKLFKIIVLILLISVSLNLFSVNFVLANGTNQAKAGDSFPNPLGTTDIPTLIGRVIQAILGVVGALALIMFIFGGLTWMTAAGNKERVEKGKDVLIWATFGLVVIFASYALVTFVVSAITGA